MFKYETLFDVYQVKFLFFFISVVLAVMLGNYLYDKANKDKNKDD